MEITRMNHVHAMLEGNLDDLISSQVCPNWCVLASLANDISFISLCNSVVLASSIHGIFGRVVCTLPMHAESVLIAVYNQHCNSLL